MARGSAEKCRAEAYDELHENQGRWPRDDGEKSPCPDGAKVTGRVSAYIAGCGGTRPDTQEDRRPPVFFFFDLC